MASIKQCDWCGEVIIGDEPRVNISSFAQGTWGHGSTASLEALKRRVTLDYHASRERDCFGQFAGALDLVEEHRDALRAVT